jgi:hypothetical protein
MKFLLRFALWATLVFVPAWFVHPGYERALGTFAARLASPSGTELEITDLELFFPFDLGVFAALVLASSWADWRKRAIMLALGLPPLVVLEVIILAVGLVLLMNSADQEAAGRFVTGLVRIGGLVGATGAWLLLLGREKLSLTTRAWLGG